MAFLQINLNNICEHELNIFSYLSEARQINELQVWILGRVEVNEDFFLTHIFGIPYPMAGPHVNLLVDLSKVSELFGENLVHFLL